MKGEREGEKENVGMFERAKEREKEREDSNIRDVQCHYLHKTETGQRKGRGAEREKRETEKERWREEGREREREIA